MNENIIVNFTHNDLDALGCMLNIKQKYTDTHHIETFHTNYHNISDKVHECINYCNKHNPRMLYITDVSFALESELLKLISTMCTEQNMPLVYIDHHLYPSEFFSEFSNIHHKIDTNKCASQLVHEILTCTEYTWLAEITSTINAYDLWLINDSKFQDGFELNEYFWNYRDIDGLCDEIFSLKSLPKNYKNKVQEINTSAFKSIKHQREKSLIHTDGQVTIAFVDEYFNYLLLEEFNKNIEYLIVANSYGVIRIRSNSKMNISKASKEEIKMKLLGTIDTGHLNAYAYKVKDSSFKTIMQEIQKITQLIKDQNGTN